MFIQVLKVLNVLGIITSTSSTTRATTILVHVSKEGITIAADSLISGEYGSVLDHECKIRLMPNSALFFSAGLTQFTNPSFHSASFAEMTTKDSFSIDEATKQYSDSVKPLLLSWWEARSLEYLRKWRLSHTPNTPAEIHMFVFVGKNAAGELGMKGEAFRAESIDNFRSLRRASLGSLSTKEIVSPKLLCFGEVSSIPPDSTVLKQVATQGVLSVLSALIAQQAKKSPDKVGLPLTIVQINATGSIRWMHPGSCSVKRF